MENFGSRLRKVLEHYGLSAYRLAKEIDFSNAATLNLLSGKTNPSFEFITRLMELYPDLNSNWLLLGRESMFLDPNMRPKSISHYSPDLVESKNAVIAALNDNIRMKDEKIEFLTAELREYRAAASLIAKDKNSSSVSSQKGKK